MSARAAAAPDEGVSLEELAAIANRRHALAEQAARAMTLHAYHAGMALVEAKARMRHGEFIPWVLASCEFSDRTARRYMWLARKTATVADLEGLSLGDAIRALQPEPEQEEREIPPLIERVAVALLPKRGPESWRASRPLPLDQIPAALAAHDRVQAESDALRAGANLPPLAENATVAGWRRRLAEEAERRPGLAGRLRDALEEMRASAFPGSPEDATLGEVLALLEREARR
jgi:hypothetical protein